MERDVIEYIKKCKTSQHDHYIYIFSAPKHVLTDQGANFISELVQKFENLFWIRHVNTTFFYPQSNEASKRTHEAIKDVSNRL